MNINISCPCGRTEMGTVVISFRIERRRGERRARPREGALNETTVIKTGNCKN